MKSGYQLERVYLDREKPPDVFGPTVDTLKGFCWKIRCPPKLKHFLWQLVTGCIAVKKNLRARGIQRYICWARCGALEESINHVFLNVLQRFRCGHSQRYRPICPSFRLALSLQTWIIYFGESYLKWTIIKLHGYYGISGKE